MFVSLYIYFLMHIVTNFDHFGRNISYMNVILVFDTFLFQILSFLFVPFRMMIQVRAIKFSLGSLCLCRLRQTQIQSLRMNYHYYYFCFSICHACIQSIVQRIDLRFQWITHNISSVNFYALFEFYSDHFLILFGKQVILDDMKLLDK